MLSRRDHEDLLGWSVERHEADRRAAEAEQEPSAWFGWLLVALAAALLVLVLLGVAGVITLPDWLTDLGGGG